MTRKAPGARWPGALVLAVGLLAGTARAGTARWEGGAGGKPGGNVLAAVDTGAGDGGGFVLDTGLSLDTAAMRVWVTEGRYELRPCGCGAAATPAPAGALLLLALATRRRRNGAPPRP